MFHHKSVLKHAFWLSLSRSHTSKMSAQIDQRIFSNNKCIDRPNGKLDGWGSFTQRTAADALLVYLLTVPVHAVPSIFLLPGNNRGVIIGDWILERNKNMALQSRNVIANAVGKKLIPSETIKCFHGPIFKRAGVPLFPNFQRWAVRRLSCIQRCCMYWDRPLTVLLLILGPHKWSILVSCWLACLFPRYWEARDSLFDKNLIYVAGQQLDMQS